MEKQALVAVVVEDDQLRCSGLRLSEAVEVEKRMFLQSLAVAGGRRICIRCLASYHSGSASSNTQKVSSPHHTSTAQFLAQFDSLLSPITSKNAEEKLPLTSHLRALKLLKLIRQARNNLDIHLAKEIYAEYTNLKAQKRLVFLNKRDWFCLFAALNAQQIQHSLYATNRSQDSIQRRGRRRSLIEYINKRQFEFLADCKAYQMLDASMLQEIMLSLAQTPGANPSSNAHLVPRIHSLWNDMLKLQSPDIDAYNSLLKSLIGDPYQLGKGRKIALMRGSGTSWQNIFTHFSGPYTPELESQPYKYSDALRQSTQLIQSVLAEMEQKHIQPNLDTYHYIILSAARLRDRKVLADKLLEIWGIDVDNIDASHAKISVKELGFPDVSTFDVLLQAFGHCDCIIEAADAIVKLSTLYQIPVPIKIWRSLAMNTYRNHSRTHKHDDVRKNAIISWINDVMQKEPFNEMPDEFVVRMALLEHLSNGRTAKFSDLFFQSLKKGVISMSAAQKLYTSYIEKYDKNNSEQKMPSVQKFEQEWNHLKENDLQEFEMEDEDDSNIYNAISRGYKIRQDRWEYVQ